jgi:hypothetical protein
LCNYPIDDSVLPSYRAGCSVTFKEERRKWLNAPNPYLRRVLKPGNKKRRNPFVVDEGYK